MDPAVLSTFAPSVQYDMLLKMRESTTAVNRERFMERTGKPLDFSSFQMQTFLKASNFRCGACCPYQSSCSCMHMKSIEAVRWYLLSVISPYSEVDCYCLGPQR